MFLQENKYFEDAFKVYERGVKIFKYPHVRDIWVTYLSKFVKRYGKSKLDRARELFEQAIDQVNKFDIKLIPQVINRHFREQCHHLEKILKISFVS